MWNQCDIPILCLKISPISVPNGSPLSVRMVFRGLHRPGIVHGFDGDEPAGVNGRRRPMGAGGARFIPPMAL